MERPVSDFAKNINFPVCAFINEINSWPSNNEKEAVSFLSGDPTIYGQKNFRMPERGYEIVRENIMNENNHGYTASTGVVAFREAVTKLYNSKVPLTASDVHINHGVNMGLLAILMAFTNEGDEVLVPEVGYPFFQDLCPAMKRVAVPYKLKKQQNYEIDLEHAGSLVNQKTSFMYVINPTNPMGTVFTRKHMQQILAFSDKHEVPLVCDEVYFKMVYPGVQALSFGEVTEDVPVIVLSGVQKILSVPGWVQSWTVIFDKNHILDTIKHNLQVVATIFLHTNTFVQYSMPKILSQIGIFTVNQMPTIFQTYKKLTQRLSIIPGLRPIPAQGTIYLSVEVDLTQFKEISSDKQLVRLLRLQENVNILPLSIMGSSLTGFRLLTCGGQALYNSFFERLGSFLQRHRK